MSTQLTRKKRNGNGELFPFRSNFFGNRFLTPSFFDLDDDFFASNANMPPANIKETSKDFKVELSAPGLKKEDFHVDVEDGMISISCEKEEEKNEGDSDNYKRREFSYSSFSRSFSLPDNIDEGNINAKYDNGVLHITIPKKEVSVSKPKKNIIIS